MMMTHKQNFRSSKTIAAVSNSNSISIRKCRSRNEGGQLLCFQLARLARGDPLARFPVNDEGCQKANRRKKINTDLS